MAYSIGSAITDTVAHLGAIRLVAQNYADAYQDTLCDGKRVWMCRDVKPTGFSFHADGDVVRAYFFELVGVIRVYSGDYVYAPTFFDDRLDPVLYGQLLATMLKDLNR